MGCLALIVQYLQNGSRLTSFRLMTRLVTSFTSLSINFQRASGGFGSTVISSRDIIPIPFDTPYGDITIVIGGWHIHNHTDIRTDLNFGEDHRMPDDMLISGKDLIDTMILLSLNELTMKRLMSIQIGNRAYIQECVFLLRLIGPFC